RRSAHRAKAWGDPRPDEPRPECRPRGGRPRAGASGRESGVRRRGRGSRRRAARGALPVSAGQPEAPATAGAPEAPPAPPTTPNRKPPGTFATALIILRKDLTLELRTMETVPAMVLFSITTFVIFHFALGRASIQGQLAGGVLTATLLFASLLAINRLFVAEREQGGFDGFLLAPVDRTAMLLGKAA